METIKAFLKVKETEANIVTLTAQLNELYAQQEIARDAYFETKDYDKLDEWDSYDKKIGNVERNLKYAKKRLVEHKQAFNTALNTNIEGTDLINELRALRHWGGYTL